VHYLTQILDRIPPRWRSPTLWFGIILADFLFFYWIGALSAPFLSPIVRLYGTIFNFVLNPPFPNPFDYPHR
jgi:hypothetical protein